ncbi:hypothetical protein CFC21_077597 [Triticum aestivum]|uniref:ubiquitinyl hydrolase 1 n=2 Tax=Triticum aestivum TaxID=4565 RepID=A0A3B6MSY7_WHEAT|nr:hypothetical protein CFC21_077597 [Triticum aestivum]
MQTPYPCPRLSVLRQPAPPWAPSEFRAESCADGPSLTGMYDLIAVVRHNGDTPDSGHYIAWVKQEGELWIQYDDAMATMHISHEVLNLCGGVLNLCGGGQIAYLCLYRARVVQGCLESARA